MMWCWQRDRHLGHWNRVDSHRKLNMTEVTYLAGRQTVWKWDPQKYGQLIFYKVAKAVLERITFFLVNDDTYVIYINPHIHMYTHFWKCVDCFL